MAADPLVIHAEKGPKEQEVEEGGVEDEREGDEED
jgi:hypothetical protein